MHIACKSCLRSIFVYISTTIEWELETDGEHGTTRFYTKFVRLYCISFVWLSSCCIHFVNSRSSVLHHKLVWTSQHLITELESWYCWNLFNQNISMQFYVPQECMKKIILHPRRLNFTCQCHSTIYMALVRGKHFFTLTNKIQFLKRKFYIVITYYLF